MVCCLYVGICFNVAPHDMPDHVVTLAWHMRPDKIRSQIRALTCEAWHVYIRRGYGANVVVFFWAWTYIILVFYFPVWHMHGAFEYLPYAFLSI